MTKTIFLDLDGTIFRHRGNLTSQAYLADILPGTIEKLNEWYAKEYKIIITTGRPEGLRSITEQQLKDFSIPYDYLLMGLGRAPRVLINDSKPNYHEPTALAFIVPRNEGISNLDI